MPPLTRNAGFRPAGRPLLGGRRTNPLDRFEGFRSLTVVLLSFSPDARLSYLWTGPAVNIKVRPVDIGIDPGNEWRPGMPLLQAEQPLQ